jgi:hypothetical protein
MSDKREPENEWFLPSSFVMPTPEETKAATSKALEGLREYLDARQHACAEHDAARFKVDVIAHGGHGYWQARVVDE